MLDSSPVWKTHQSRKKNDQKLLPLSQHASLRSSIYKYNVANAQQKTLPPRTVVLCTPYQVYMGRCAACISIWDHCNTKHEWARSAYGWTTSDGPRETAFISNVERKKCTPSACLLYTCCMNNIDDTRYHVVVHKKPFTAYSSVCRTPVLRTRCYAYAQVLTGTRTRNKYSSSAGPSMIVPVCMYTPTNNTGTTAATAQSIVNGNSDIYRFLSIP